MASGTAAIADAVADRYWDFVGWPKIRITAATALPVLRARDNSEERLSGWYPLPKAEQKDLNRDDWGCRPY